MTGMNHDTTPDGFHLSASARQSLRLRVVHAVRVEGIKQVDVIRTMGVSKTALYEWLSACVSVNAGPRR